MSWKKGEAPWEQSESTPTSFKAGQAPWEVQSSPDPSNTIEQMPEHLSWTDRAIAKNLAANPQKQLEYYQKQHPDKKWALMGSDVYSQGADGKWYAADPNNLGTAGISSDIVGDVIDLGADTAIGAAQKLATLGGFMGGAMIPLPGTALAGGALASSASGGLLEAMRQKAGDLAGIPNNYDESEIKNQAAFGLATPLLTGVDKAPKELKDQARGLIKRGIDKVGPAAVNFLTGIPEHVQKTYLKNKAGIQNIANVDGQFATLQDITKKANTTMDDYLAKLGQDIGDLMDDKKVNPQAAMKILRDKIEQLKKDSTGENNLFNAKVIPVLEAKYNTLFQLQNARPPDMSKLPQAQPIYKEIENALSQKIDNIPASFKSLKEAVPSKQSSFSVYDPGQENFLKDINNFARGNVDDDLAAIQKSAADLAKASAQKASKERDEFIKRKVSELEGLKQKFTQTHYGDEISRKKLFEIQQQAKIMDRKLTNPIADLNEFERASSQPISSTYHTINKILDDDIKKYDGVGSQQAKDAYRNFVHIQDRVQPAFKDDQKTFNTIANLNKGSKVQLANDLKSLQNQGALDLVDDIDNFRALNAYHGMGKNPYVQDIVQKGGEKAQGLAAAGGFAAGYRLNPWLATPLGAISGFGAKMVGGPAPARFYNALGGYADEGADFMRRWGLTPTGAMTGAVLPSPWADPNQQQP